MNTVVTFNKNWTFAKTALGVESADSLIFEDVAIPHDWLIYDSLNLYENSIGWYKNQLTYNGQDDHVLLYFEGVYMDASLYINGQWVGEWKYGYSSFEFDITPALKEGHNDILLKVVHQSPNSRWYSGAGIYRNVWLKTRNKHYIETNGVYLSTQHSDNHWTVEVETAIHAESPLSLRHSLYDGNQLVTEINAKVVGDGVDKQTFTVEKPKLWSPNEPHLYQIKTDLIQADTVIETVTNPLGFRKIELSPDQGLVLNGVQTKIYGVCEHHDLGALGAAVNPVALKRRLEILKDMGVNGIRTAHNMPAKELMVLADEMGFFIVSEAFDMWERQKTTYDYARFFNEWAHRDVESWVKRDRNHPSLIMWSIGNEIYDTHAGERGQEITRMLQDYVLEFDPKQNGFVTIGSNYMPWENAQACADIVKIAGYNYAEKYYNQHHQDHPDWVIYGSETASVVQSRGIYHFPANQPILSDDDLQCSSLGNSSTSWGAKSAEATIIAERDTPFSIGQFIWTGFDYIGEPTPYHTKNSYFGQIDTATFKKDAYYIYQANWTNYQDAPMIHLFPYWDFNPGQIIDVRVATNAPKFELYLNDTLIASRTINHQVDTDLIPTIQVPYEVGELKAIAYDLDGQIIAEDYRNSFKDAVSLVATADKSQLKADGQDLVFVEITTIDEDGHAVENATNRVTVEVAGAGKLVGLDNGDSTDYDQYKGTSRRLFSGKLMAIIQATDTVGDVVIKVSSPEIEAVELKLNSVAAEMILNDVFAENTARPVQTGQAGEIPLRKIEILSQAGQNFSPELTSIQVDAQLYPHNASYHDLEWSVVNDAGISSNIAQIESDGKSATITALGDGEFRVRCSSKNGSSHVQLISEIEMHADGLGPAYKNPYDFISGGLYDDSVGDVSSGNERGFATSRDSETQVGFTNIDFGEGGTDYIHLPIFALSADDYEIQIWEGVPREDGSTLLADVIYQKESIWNVYQPESYRLSKRLTGLSSIYFVTNDKIHLKGFSFEPYNRAFEKNLALDTDNIYGDSFEKTAQAIEDIGNNVSLIFKDMDFGENGANRLIVNGHSPIDKNTIHVRFQDDDGQVNQLIEFTESAGYEERSFDLEHIQGKKDVTFIFLPGSQFNFAWFQFQE
ncbi:MAG TPA: DUF4982 domain-containing protein [Candidatus Ligilactobacillus excrementipullorum]|nr:DUF4982 domain-containing protein [Candidatus Ligilactobacillus excrementipullorum]